MYRDRLSEVDCLGKLLSPCLSPSKANSSVPGDRNKLSPSFYGDMATATALSSPDIENAFKSRQSLAGLRGKDLPEGSHSHGDSPGAARACQPLPPAKVDSDRHALAGICLARNHVWLESQRQNFELGPKRMGSQCNPHRIAFHWGPSALVELHRTSLFLVTDSPGSLQLPV